MANAKHDLSEARMSAGLEYLKFKKECELKIKSNEKCFFDLKEKLTRLNQKDKAKYQKKVSMIEQKNLNLKKKLANYKNDKEQYKWTYFKRSINHDMEEVELLMWSLK